MEDAWHESDVSRRCLQSLTILGNKQPCHTSTTANFLTKPSGKSACFLNQFQQIEEIHGTSDPVPQDSMPNFFSSKKWRVSIMACFKGGSKVHNGLAGLVPDGQPIEALNTQVRTDHCLVWDAYKNSRSLEVLIKASSWLPGHPIHQPGTK